MSHVGQRFEVGHLHLRVGYNLQEDARRVAVYVAFHLLHVGQVAHASLHAKAFQRAGEQREGVAKEMLRGYDVLALRRKCHHGVADGRHTGVERHHVLGSGERFDTVFEVSYGGIFHS